MTLIARAYYCVVHIANCQYQMERREDKKIGVFNSMFHIVQPANTMTLIRATIYNEFKWLINRLLHSLMHGRLTLCWHRVNHLDWCVHEQRVLTFTFLWGSLDKMSHTNSAFNVHKCHDARLIICTDALSRHQITMKFIRLFNGISVEPCMSCVCRDWVQLHRGANHFAKWSIDRGIYENL